MDEQRIEALQQRVTRHVGVHAAAGRDDFISECTSEAFALVTKYIGARSDLVPTAVADRAILECAADLFWRQQARSGVATFDAGDAGLETVRVGLDPMRVARPILAPWLGPVIA